MKDGGLSPNVIKKTIEFARMMLGFGLVERVTHHEDGITHETDSTHTVMLGVMACAFAAEFAPHLARGKIAEFALIHDLVEVYAGDTNSFAKHGDDTEKKAREEAALERIKGEYDSVFPWLSKTIEEYESLNSPEARYVKVFDKVLPKIVHLLNKGVSVRELGHDHRTMAEFHVHQFDRIKETYGADQEEVMELLNAINEEALIQIFN